MWRGMLGYACLLLPFCAVLWVPAYARATPTLVGLPFFYWYQLMWVFVTAALMAVAYVALHGHGSGDVGAGAS